MNFRELPNQRSPANLISAHRRLGNACGRLTKLKGIQPEGLDEMVRLAAALERSSKSRASAAIACVIWTLTSDRAHSTRFALEDLRISGSASCLKSSP